MEAIGEENREPEQLYTKQDVDFLMRFYIGQFISHLDERTSLDKDYLETAALTILYDMGDMEAELITGVPELWDQITGDENE